MFVKKVNSRVCRCHNGWSRCVNRTASKYQVCYDCRVLNGCSKEDNHYLVPKKNDNPVVFGKKK